MLLLNVTEKIKIIILLWSNDNWLHYKQQIKYSTSQNFKSLHSCHTKIHNIKGISQQTSINTGRVIILICFIWRFYIVAMKVLLKDEICEMCWRDDDQLWYQLLEHWSTEFNVIMWQEINMDNMITP